MGALGSFIGFIVFPMLSDNKGPKLALVISWNIAWLGCFIVLIALNYYMILIGYFLVGFGINPAITLHFTLINDHSSKI